MAQSALEIAFVDVDPGDREMVQRLLPSAWRTTVSADKLSNVIGSIPDCVAVSLFVHSPVDQAVLDRLPKLRVIATRSTGYDHIDIAACKTRDVAVCNVPAYGSNTVAEHAFALLLPLVRRVVPAVIGTRAGNFGIAALRGQDLASKTFGVIGTGRIGRHAARIAQGFDMRVIAYDPCPDQALVDADILRYCSLDTLLAESDVISLHCPLTDDTHHLLKRPQFERMKRGVVLINTARGEVVDNQALIWALDSGIVAAAGLDVLEAEACLLDPKLAHREPEQMKCNRALLARDNVIITPHIAFNTVEAVERLYTTSIENIAQFIAGHAQNRVA